MYKLVVENTVKVPVKFNMNSEGKIVNFNFSLICDRLTSEQIQQALDEKNGLTKDFVKQVVKDWKGQTLVIGDDDKPAEFSQEALDVMLSSHGLAGIIFASYLNEVGAKEKN